MSSNQRATFLCRGKKERETGGQAGMQTDIVKIRFRVAQLVHHKFKQRKPNLLENLLNKFEISDTVNTFSCVKSLATSLLVK